MTGPRHRQPLPRPLRLTPRQLEAAHAAAQGLTDDQIARRLRISPHTAKLHLAAARERLGLHNRVELARWVWEHEEARP